MEHFTPDMRLTAVDAGDLIVTFDSASAHDHARATRVLRIARDFSALRVEVSGFADGELAAVGDQKEYRGAIALVVSGQDGAEQRHVLAEPVLWLAALSRQRKSGTYLFASSEQVLLAVRHGMADAFSEALGIFYAKEAQVDTLTRAPAQPVHGELRAAAPSYAAPAAPEAAPRRPQAANDAAEKKRVRNRLIIAAVATPVLVWGLLAASGAGSTPADPIKSAVADAMKQDPRSIQAQVDLTKETLKQMGLDPGKAGDTGCLTAE